MDIDIQTKSECINRLRITKKTYKILKRVMDITGALVGLIMLIPLTLFVWGANIISKNKNSIFFVQKRIGKDGKAFKMYKYCSMVPNADKKLKKYLLENPQANEEFKRYRKLKNDPRITPVGKFIRRTCLDEFPQFINVLKGEMSLVGPRPYLVREKRIIKNAYKEIIKVKPGITGPWQVSGREHVSFEERLNIDMEYINNYSFKNDIKYLFKTIFKLY